ncbi:MAG: hypothetical protein JW803_05065 [Endomicrobiales bacterium]|nr:hypothetical protein [Endomicrobiales bacterium]
MDALLDPVPAGTVGGGRIQMDGIPIKRILIASLFLFAVSLSFAVMPRQMNYQGKLTDDTGAPLNGTYNFTFTLYDASGSTWTETQNGITVENGLYNVQLGSVNNALADLPFNTTYFLEIKVESETLSPRQMLTVSPYSFRSRYSDFASSPGQHASTHLSGGTDPLSGVLAPTVIVSSVALNSIHNAQVNGSAAIAISKLASSGTLGAGVVASSIAVNAVHPRAVRNGEYDLATSTLNIAVINAYMVKASSFYSTGADLAEIYPSMEFLEAGDIVSMSEERGFNVLNVEKSKVPYDPKVLGVVSTKPGQVLGAGEKGYPIALAGRVPVKVTAENGAIEPGDLITTSSMPGYGMKATQDKRGTVIGKALESHDFGTKKILVFIMLR